MSRKNSGKEKLPRTITGVISVTSRGTGYVTTDVYDKDVEIPFAQLNQALDGDHVSVSIAATRPRPTGAVVKVLERARDQFVGVLTEEKGSYTVSCDNRRMYARIRLSPTDVSQFLPLPLVEPVKVLVKMTRWDSGGEPEGSIISLLGPEGEHETEMQSIVLESGFDLHFPGQVEQHSQAIKESATISSEEIARRRDFRRVPTCTIDPETAKDFDDALSMSSLPDGSYEIGVHIADVTHYVRTGSPIDKEAKKRGTSVYLVDRTIPMLPEVLSNDVCSLNPDEEKLTFSAVLTLDKDGYVAKRWFGKTIIRSQKRFSYEEAQRVLDTGKGPMASELAILNGIAKKIRSRRMDEGAIDFDQDEISFTLDERGKPIAVTKKQRMDTNKLIEEFMLLANREVAEYIYTISKDAPARNRTFIYRIHDVPDPEKIEELGIFLRAIGYSFETNNGQVNTKDLTSLFQQIQGKPEENLIKTATIRSMAKAVYSTKNIGHFGLSFRYYTHFTSPIRRYPDMMVHRILATHVAGEPIKNEELLAYEKLAIQSSQREISAVQAERDSIKYKQVEYLSSHIGEEFEAAVSGVTEWGLFIQEKNTLAEGLVRMRDLPGQDYYVLDKSRYRIVGERKKRSFTLGDPLRVKLTRADLESRTLDFVPV